MVLAELIRTRRLVFGEVVERDIVLCEAGDEEELLETRPDLRGWRREATRFLTVGVVLYFEPSSTY